MFGLSLQNWVKPFDTGLWFLGVRYLFIMANAGGIGWFFGLWLAICPFNP